VTKRTKSSEQKIDAARHIKQADVKNIEGKTQINIILPINNENSLNPNALIDSLKAFSGENFLFSVTRLGLLKSDLSEFV
jgi:hypothetical protein